MQRIIRSASLYSALSSDAHKQSEILLKHCPPHVASVFASSRKGSDGVLEWWSPLGGQAIPFVELTEIHQQALLKVLEQRKKSFEDLAKQLDHTGQSDTAQTLRTLLIQTDFRRLYSIDNQPVVIDWHIPKEKKVITPAVISTTAPLVAKKKRLWPWLLLLLLFTLLGFLLCWLWFQKKPVPADIASFSEENPSRIQNYSCSQDDTRVVPDFVTVFDTSGSMTLNINATAADEEWWLYRNVLGSSDPDRLLRIQSKPTREEVAKHAYIEMIASLHPDIDTRLITFNGCNAVVDHGLYSHKQRPDLIQTLLQTQANDGTPLTASLRLAANRVDGVNKDAMIILFIDGEDGCGEDVCALSAELAQTKPRLQINVVDVSGNGLSRCAAEVTNGRLYSSQDTEQISSLLIQAAEEFSDQQCD